jgi:hypothetical protein
VIASTTSTAINITIVIIATIALIEMTMGIQIGMCSIPIITDFNALHPLISAA